jgi:hypothetical protein
MRPLFHRLVYLGSEEEEGHADGGAWRHDDRQVEVSAGSDLGDLRSSAGFTVTGEARVIPGGVARVPLRRHDRVLNAAPRATSRRTVGLHWTSGRAPSGPAGGAGRSGGDMGGAMPAPESARHATSRRPPSRRVPEPREARGARHAPAPFVSLEPQNREARGARQAPALAVTRVADAPRPPSGRAGQRSSRTARPARPAARGAGRADAEAGGCGRPPPPAGSPRRPADR